jgi:outer membrane protein OmpA-like peptidoglycan-associated protein
MDAQKTQQVSNQRAQRILRYMKSKKVNERKVLVTGVGGRDAIANIRTKAGQDKNRRIEIEIVRF